MKIKLKDIVLLALLAALMCVGDFAMEWLPNIHLVGVLITVSTIVYRHYALMPIGVYVVIQGVYGGFDLWWIPYLYIWAVLWGMVMLVPRKLPVTIRFGLYVIACSLHGFLFGTLYAPAQVLIFFGGDFSKMIPWIISGLSFDIMHGIGNFVLGSALIYPMVKILERADKYKK